MLQPKALSVGIVMTLVLLAGCAPSASTVLTLPENSLAQRQLQTRHFETNAEERFLAACTAVLQDMGFQIDETSPRLGCCWPQRCETRTCSDPSRVWRQPSSRSGS